MNKQEFSKIKSIEAKDGQILIKTNEGDHRIKDTVLTVHEAAARAKALNKMANKFEARDRKMLDELITEIIDRCREAQQQILRSTSLPDDIKSKALTDCGKAWMPDLYSPEHPFSKEHQFPPVST